MSPFDPRRRRWSKIGPVMSPWHVELAREMNVEAEYRHRIDAMSAVERIRRAEALFRWSRDYLARSVLAAQGPMSGDRLRHEVALRQYQADPSARKLIGELRARVSR